MGPPRSLCLSFSLTPHQAPPAVTMLGSVQNQAWSRHAAVAAQLGGPYGRSRAALLRLVEQGAWFPTWIYLAHLPLAAALVACLPRCEVLAPPCSAGWCASRAGRRAGHRPAGALVWSAAPGGRDGGGCLGAWAVAWVFVWVGERVPGWWVPQHRLVCPLFIRREAAPSPPQQTCTCPAPWRRAPTPAACAGRRGPDTLPLPHPHILQPCNQAYTHTRPTPAALLQYPHRGVREKGYLPPAHGVYISRWHHGSPAHRYGLFALHWITGELYLHIQTTVAFTVLSCCPQAGACARIVLCCCVSGPLSALCTVAGVWETNGLRQHHPHLQL